MKTTTHVGFGYLAMAALFTATLTGCSLLSPSMEAPFEPKVAGDNNVITGITIQEAMPLGLIVLMIAMMLKGAWTLWLSHRREMRRIDASRQALLDNSPDVS